MPPTKRTKRPIHPGLMIDAMQVISDEAGLFVAKASAVAALLEQTAERPDPSTIARLGHELSQAVERFQGMMWPEED